LERGIYFLRGVYLVFFRLNKEKVVEVGALGEVKFESGRYVYIGSAMNSLESRVQRHVSGSKENAHWHIDYFSAVTEPLGFAAFAVSSDWECIFSHVADENWVSIDDFGASDCDCDAHLYRKSVDDC